MRASRRSFLRQSLAVSAGFVGLSQYLLHSRPLAATVWSPTKQWLELPEGFSAKIISRWGDKMNDGFYVPNRHDGMAAFDIKG